MNPLMLDLALFARVQEAHQKTRDYYELESEKHRKRQQAYNLEQLEKMPLEWQRKLMMSWEDPLWQIRKEEELGGPLFGDITHKDIKEAHEHNLRYMMDPETLLLLSKHVEHIAMPFDKKCRECGEFKIHVYDWLTASEDKVQRDLCSDYDQERLKRWASNPPEKCSGEFDPMALQSHIYCWGCGYDFGQNKWRREGTNDQGGS